MPETTTSITAWVWDGTEQDAQALFDLLATFDATVEHIPPNPRRTVKYGPDKWTINSDGNLQIQWGPDKDVSHWHQIWKGKVVGIRHGRTFVPVEG